MKEISHRAYRAVEDDEIRLHPAKFKNTYRHWMENVRDWCISRQLWWGHRIPAYYFGAGEDDFVVAETLAQAVELANTKTGRKITAADLQQDSDVLDTWASSWLWPIEVFKGFNDEFFDSVQGKITANKTTQLGYYYPTQVLVTAPEILFFWVARMIIAGYEYMNEKPFEDVYLTGIVRDKQGRKMSKSLGNSPDPLDLITKYGSDGVRTGMLFSSPAGNDLLFDEKLCEQGRNFANKIWNAFRLVKGWAVEDLPTPAENAAGVKWFEARLNQALEELEDHFGKFRMSDALMTVYKLTWDDFCSWYLEIIKPEYRKPIDRFTHEQTIAFFETVLKILHPFMPFITEELWHELKERQEKDCILVAAWPQPKKYETAILNESAYAFQAIGEIRNIRNAKGLSPKQSLTLKVKLVEQSIIDTFWPVVKKMAHLHEVAFVHEKELNAQSFVIKSTEFFVPLGDTLDKEKEREAILKDLDYQRGFLASVNKKLSNERFVTNARSEVIELERKKQSDTEAKIKVLEENLKMLG
jgi:valyl-tRNA synthetase